MLSSIRLLHSGVHKIMPNGLAGRVSSATMFVEGELFVQYVTVSYMPNDACWARQLFKVA
jgi:hypothetical protein